jgi:hypothetical protein
MKLMAKNHLKSLFTLFFLFIISIGFSIFINQFAREENKIAGASGDQILQIKKQAETINKHCLDSDAVRQGRDSWSRLICYSGEMEKIALKNGQSNAQKILTQLQTIDPIARNCHFIAHGIGWGVYKRNPKMMQDSINRSSSFCNGGEQHGIIEQYIESLPDGTLVKEKIPEICGKNPKSDCNRMVGHMLLVETQNDMDKAISLCGGMYDEEQKFICYGGLMMERFIAFNLIDHGILPRKDQSVRLFEFREYCSTLQGNVKLACWQGLAHPAYYYFDRDPQKVLDFCNTAPFQEAARECKVHSLSELVDVLKIDLKTAKPICKQDRSNDPFFEKDCYIELVTLFLKPDLIEAQQKDEVTKYCSSLPGEYQKECYVNIGTSLKYARTSTIDIEKFCANAPVQYKNYCIGS